MLKNIVVPTYHVLFIRFYLSLILIAFKLLPTVFSISPVSIELTGNKVDYEIRFYYYHDYYKFEAFSRRGQRLCHGSIYCAQCAKIKYSVSGRWFCFSCDTATPCFHHSKMLYSFYIGWTSFKAFLWSRDYTRPIFIKMIILQ